MNRSINCNIYIIYIYIHTQWKILSNKVEQNYVVSKKINGNVGDHFEGDKPSSERQASQVFSHEETGPKQLII
jgi:hypothetical protein